MHPNEGDDTRRLRRPSITAARPSCHHSGCCVWKTPMVDSAMPTLHLVFAAMTTHLPIGWHTFQIASGLLHLPCPVANCSSTTPLNCCISQPSCCNPKKSPHQAAIACLCQSAPTASIEIRRHNANGLTALAPLLPTQASGQPSSIIPMAEQPESQATFLAQ